MSVELPIAWAEDKRAKAARYIRGEVGAALARVVPVLAPGSPVAAWVGVACNGGRNENTTGWIRCDDAERAAARETDRTPLGRRLDAYARTGLHELGPFGVEAGHAPGLVGPDGSPWYVGVRSPDVARALGRAIPTDTGAWHGDVEAQVAVGVWNNARHGREAFRRIDPMMRWKSDAPWSLWTFAVATMAWSAGDGGAAEHVNRYYDELRNVPEPLRWGAFVREASGYAGRGSRHDRPSYSAMRTCQKLEAARVAARDAGDAAALAWLDDGIGADEARVFERLVASADA